MSDVILIILCTPSHLIFTTIHFRDKETKGQRNEVACPRLHSWQVLEPRFSPKQAGCRDHTITIHRKMKYTRNTHEKFFK